MTDANLITINSSVKKDFVRGEYVNVTMWQLPADIRASIDQRLQAASDKATG